MCRWYLSQDQSTMSSIYMPSLFPISDRELSKLSELDLFITIVIFGNMSRLIKRLTKG